MEPIYTTANARSGTMTVLIIAALMVGAAAGVVLAVVDSFWGGFITTVFCGLTAILILLILPSRLEAWADRLTIVFPAWRWNIPFETVANVRAARSYEPYAYMGVRFATDPAKAVVIERVNANLFRRPNIIVSPEDRERFLREVEGRLQR